MHYYSHHIGDYRRDTSALSMMEHGAYRLLMDEYYVSGKSLPLDVVKLCRIVRALSKSERDAVSFILSEFFTQEEDGFHQRRIDAEIELYEQQRVKASEAGKASAAKRNAIKTGNARSTPVQRPLDSCTNETATEEATQGATKIQPPNNHEPITIVLTAAAATEGLLKLDSLPPPKPKKETQADPRFTPFKEAFIEAYQTATGTKYAFQGGKDGAALSSFLKTFKTVDLEEFTAALRWCRDVVASNPFAKGCVTHTSNLAAFCSSWNQIVEYHQNYQPPKR